MQKIANMSLEKTLNSVKECDFPANKFSALRLLMDHYFSWINLSESKSIQVKELFSTDLWITSSGEQLTPPKKTNLSETATKNN